MKKVLTPGERALTLAYVHCELLKRNLSVTIHELKVADKKYKPLKDNLEKLRSAAYTAFKEINHNLKQSSEFEHITADIEAILDQTWSE